MAKLRNIQGHLVKAGPYRVLNGRTYVLIDYNGLLNVFLDRVVVPPLLAYPEAPDLTTTAPNDAEIATRRHAELLAQWHELVRSGDHGIWYRREDALALPTATEPEVVKS